jgi:tRNA-2-methylthio-N6-dimethylallyladenosine synthase
MKPTGSPRKTAFIRSYGCQMNVYDSERMADLLTSEGYEIIDAPGDADLVILNTCHIREKAAEKVYSELGRLRIGKAHAQTEGRNPLIAVAGCVAQAEGEEMIRRAPAVDLVFGPQVYHRLPQLLVRASAGEKVVETEFPTEEKFDALPNDRRSVTSARAASAFLTIQEGCDKFCTFCVVPYTRGAEFSRSPEEIVDEAGRLVAAGVSEITLLGQNVNAYHGVDGAGRGHDLPDLLDTLADIDGLARLRYTTSHPRDMTQKLIAAHRDNDKLMPYLHLPIQSGADRILDAMNRKHTASEYLTILADLRAARPDIAISSDFIVGFPGETEAEFEATLRIVESVGYAQAYSFKYSPRPGTPAADSDAQVPEPVKAERLAWLQDLLERQQFAFNRNTENVVLPVLLDRVGRMDGQLAGRTPYLQAIQVDAPMALLGTIQQVRVEKAGPHSLFGVLAGGAVPVNTETRITLLEGMTS